jgi:hypothetical protein
MLHPCLSILKNFNNIKSRIFKVTFLPFYPEIDCGKKVKSCKNKSLTKKYLLFSHYKNVINPNFRMLKTVEGDVKT